MMESGTADRSKRAGGLASIGWFTPLTRSVDAQPTNPTESRMGRLVNQGRLRVARPFICVSSGASDCSGGYWGEGARKLNRSPARVKSIVREPGRPRSPNPGPRVERQAHSKREAG